MEKVKLLKLADHLENLPRKRFNIGQWCREEACGTVACAFGWCPTIFPRSGLKIMEDKWLGDIQYKTKRGTWYDLEAATEFFKISFADAHKIFIGNSYREYCKHDKNGFLMGNRGITPKRVARRIRHYVETGEIK